MSSKRKQEEKSTRMLRELVALSGNKHCFDCHQRGPTYVNMTIGSFVCTSCSGILRGLNPPHRAKSISMAIFTPEEVEMVRQRGNEYCKKVWLGLYDGDTRFDGNRDEHQMKEFLPLKYEKKRWYVSPSEIARQQSMLDSQKTGGSANSAGGTSPTQASSGYASNEGSNSLIDTAISPPRQQKHSGVPTPFTQSVAPNQSHVSASSQLVNAFGGDPFGSPIKQTQPINAPQTAPASSTPSNNFANFANFDAFSTPPNNSPSLAPPLSATSTATMSKSATMPLPQAAAPAPGGGVNYSALAELDELFTTSTSITPHNPPPQQKPANANLNQSWNTGLTQNTHFAGPAPAMNGIVGGPPLSHSMNAGVPKSNTFNAFAPPTTAAFGAGSNPFMSGGGVSNGGGGWGAPPAVNPFGESNVAAPAPGVANPFGHSGNVWSQQVLPPHPPQTGNLPPWQQNPQQIMKPASQAPNPFMGLGASNGTTIGSGGSNWNPFL